MSINILDINNNINNTQENNPVPHFMDENNYIAFTGGNDDDGINRVNEDIVQDIIHLEIDISQKCETSAPTLRGLRILNHEGDNFIRMGTPFEVQGNIISEDGGEVVCRGLPISKEVESMQQLKEIYESGNFQTRPFYEGSLLRFFYYHEKWNIATSRKLDAFKSRWGSLSSFGQLFEIYLREEKNTSITNFEESLDKQYIYYFLFTSKSVYYVHPSTISDLRLLVVMDKKGNRVSKPEHASFQMISHQPFESLKHLFDDGQILGVVMENEQERYTLFSSSYNEKKRVYGNKNFIAQRILELHGNEQDTQSYISYFPESVTHFKRVSDEIARFCKKAHRTYINRYVQKNFVEVDAPVNHFVKLIHKNYLENKKPTYLSNVVELFYSKPADIQYLYLKSYLPSTIGGKLEK
jgi:hypothetical protein